MNDNILSLSGGNQQKALFARAFGSEAEIVLMDDPMRGVDVGTKQEIYEMIRAEAGKDRTFLWYTTEMDELKHCDHVYVFRNGPHRGRSGARRAERGEGAAFLLRGSLMMREGVSPEHSLLPAGAPQPAAGPVADRPAGGDLLSPAPGDELFRPQSAAQSGGADRARHHRPDVRHHGQRPGPLHRRLCRLHGLRRGDLAERGAAAGHRRAARRHRSSTPPSAPSSICATCPRSWSRWACPSSGRGSPSCCCPRPAAARRAGCWASWG